jgi:hypothetical protein
LRTEPELTRVVLTPQTSPEQQTRALCAAAKHVLANDWTDQEILDLFQALGFIKAVDR